MENGRFRAPPSETMARARLGGVLAILAATASGCFSVNAYQSARAVDRGEVSLAAGVSVFAGSEDPDALPVPIPSLAARWGASRDVDVGAMVSAIGHFRGDVKYNPLSTRYLDLAVSTAGFLQLFSAGNDLEESSLILGAEVLLLADLKATRSISIVGWGGPGYLKATSGVGTWYPRIGGGVKIWGDGFWVHPEVSTMIDRFTGSPADVAIGLAFGLEDRGDE